MIQVWSGGQIICGWYSVSEGRLLFLWINKMFISLSLFKLNDEGLEYSVDSGNLAECQYYKPIFK